ncbi:MAG TPA: phosphate ABC transporter substrate-binding protein [Syntrophorhabdales bacterium]|nr:phosphate ABC transporter substrate-binding protein [Syntrophorhabdales bacterium]
MRSNLATPIALLLFIALICWGTFDLRKSGAGRKDTVTLAGSTSVMPFSEKLAEYFMLSHPRLSVEVQGGGSSAGIQATINRTVDIGMSSRNLKDDEKVHKQILICYDGISIIVHPSNPVRDISLDQIQKVYSGRIRNWRELGWIDRNIDAVSREEGSGTRGAFEELVMGKAFIDDGIMVQDSNGSVKEVVATDPYAIGYISLGIVDQKVKALTIDGVIPSVRNIIQQKYGMVRPFLYLTATEPAGAVKVFIDFVLSRDGQNILRKEGLVPIRG